MTPARLTIVLSTLLAFGCGTRGTLYTDALKPLPIVATRTALVQVVPQTRRAVVITPGEPNPTGVRISAGARYASVVPGSDLVAILSGTSKAPKLDVVDVAGHDASTLDAPGFFDAIRFSDDGRFGVLIYTAAASTGGLVARNLNEVGLWRVGQTAVVRLQLDTESLAPRSVLFAPAEPNRQLVAVTLERGVAVFDALHPEVAPRRISIRPQGSASDQAVVEAVFSPDAHWLFLRASGLDDVIVVELGPEIGQPVSASINFISGGRGLSDIAAPPADIKDAVLAVFPASRDAWLLDARGIQDGARRLVLSESLNRLQVLDGHRVLLWEERGTSIAAWDLADGRSGSAVLDGNFTAPFIVPALNKALFPHAAVRTTAGSGPALSTVTVVDETNRLRLRLQGIQLSQPLSAAGVDTNGLRLFFTVTNSPSVVTMDLRTMELAEIELDQPAANLLYVPVGDWVAADRATAYGDVTVVPAGTTERSGALHYLDFAFTDDLQRVEDAP